MKQRLNILFLLQDLPYPVSDGMRQKTFNLLALLAKHHTCDVISFSSGGRGQLEEAQRALPEVNFLAAVDMEGAIRRSFRTLWNLVKLLPPSFARYQSPSFKAEILKAVESRAYDVVHYDIVNMAQFHALLPSVPSVHSPNDATSLCSYRMACNVTGFFDRARLFIASRLLRRYERKHYAEFSYVHVVSQMDADYLRIQNPSCRVEYIPLGMSIPMAVTAAQELVRRPFVLMLSESNVEHVSPGLMDFLNITVPQLLTLNPELKIQIHGKGVQEVIAGHALVSDHRVSASSWVEDLNTLIRAADVVVLCDKSGTGVKTRAMQAMVCGVAVVGSQASFSGMGARLEDGRDCVVTGSPEAMAEVVAALLEAPARRAELGAAAASLIRAEFSWDALADRYEGLYFAALGKDMQT